MKIILHIAESFGSGVLNYIKNLCEWQCKEYKIYVAYGIRPETPEDFQKQFDPNITFIKVNGFTREIEPVNDLKAFFHIKKIVKETDPDLIHLHSTKAGVLGRWAINSKKYRILYSPHAYSFLMQDCPSWKKRVYKTIEKLSDRKNILTIADVGSEFRISKQVCGKSMCINNGINTKELDAIISRIDLNSTIDENDGRIKICMLGKVVPQKNPKLFNEIASRLPEYDFIWIGAGPLESMLSSTNITITGWMPREEAVSKLLKSDIFLFTSAWESLSIALLEVMYVGVACVVSDIPENTDVIKNGVNGFSCGSVDEYMTAIRKLAADIALRKKYVDEARKVIIDEYNTKQIEEEYRKLFRTLGV